MFKDRSLSKLLLSFAELVVFVAVTVSAVLGVDYLLVKCFFESFFSFEFAKAFVVVTVFEGIFFILVGIYFLQKKVEESRGGHIYFFPAGRLPIFPYKVVYRARRRLGGTLIVAGITLFVVGMFVIPIHYKL